MTDCSDIVGMSLSHVSRGVFTLWVVKHTEHPVSDRGYILLKRLWSRAIPVPAGDHVSGHRSQ